MDLKETVGLMTSTDYKDRFKAEYYQLRTRALKLKGFLDNWDKLDFTPNCPKELLEEQYCSMAKYKEILLSRARIEGIQL